MSALDAVRARQSWSKVEDTAPTREELLTFVAAAGRVADHSSLRPWRLIELRGADREVLGAAIAKAQGDSSPSSKPLRAPLLIAVVASYRKSKVARWEQEAVASGVAHMLSLLLDDAGWGVFWRTAGSATRSKPVAKLHGLDKNEELLGWLYVGGKPERSRPGRRKPVDASRFVSRLPGSDEPAPRDGAIIAGEADASSSPSTDGSAKKSDRSKKSGTSKKQGKSKKHGGSKKSAKAKKHKKSTKAAERDDSAQ